VELSGGSAAAPLVALAEAVSVPRQERIEFEELLKKALELPQDRLANRVAQRRARWLLSRTERLFTN
jgi:predicted anti-sigma-YlaC factor YlaD